MKEIELIAELINALESAINNADAWCDDDWGCPTPDLDKERELLVLAKQQFEEFSTAGRREQ